MATLREEAEFLRLALGMGLIEKQRIIDWADQSIAKMDDPPMQMIDVALSGNRPANELLSLLALIPGSGNMAGGAHRVLGFLSDRFIRGVVSLERAVDMLWAYQNWADIPEKECLQAGYFQDALFCAQQGYYGSLDTVREDLVKFLMEFGTCELSDKET